MKRTITVGIIVILLALLFVGLLPSSIANETTTVKISPNTQTVSQGESFSINVVIEPHTAITGAQFNLQVNPSLVKINSVTEGNLFKQTGANTIFSSGTIDNNTGVVKYVWGNTLGAGETVSSAGTFATINLTAIAGGLSPLKLITVEPISVKISDPTGNPVPINIKNGTVIISTNGGDIGSSWSGTIKWTIPSDTSFTVSLAGGADTIDFNASGESTTMMEPIGQDDEGNVPIVIVENTGNQNLNFSFNIPAGIPSWVTMLNISNNNTYVGSSAVNKTEVNIATNVAPGSNTSLYLWSNVTKAPFGITSKTVYINSTSV